MRKFDVLYNFISPVTGRILLTTDYVLLGDDKGIATPTKTIKLINLPDLTDNNIWVGDNGDPNRPQESSVLKDTQFIIKTPNSQLPSAEALDTAIYTTSPPNSGSSPPGIAKIEADGSISIAIPDVDYVAPVILGNEVVPTKSHNFVTKHYVDKMINALEERLLKDLEQTVEKKISKL
jgi:hypothetical protein